MILAALDRVDGSFAGSTMLFAFQRPVAEVGFWMVPHARGRGLTEAAVALTIRWGFEELGLERIVGLTDPANTASQAAMERAGMRFDRRDREYDHPIVGRQDVVIYASELD
jgi:RimJ/RimL family protein N-acetyltransferase